MKVNISKYPSLISILKNKDQIITLDANFLIPPDRSKYAKRSFDFSLFKSVWLDPVFTAFPKMAIHEAVYEELVDSNLRDYIDELSERTHQPVIIHKDSSLTEVEKVLRDSIEAKIYPHTNYEPNIDNKDDRGEVKSLSFIAVKGFLYFAAHDNNVLQLIEKAEEWSTGLDNVQAIQMYELIYFLYIKGLSQKDALKMLYKYQYRLTQREKNINSEWGEFTEKMNDLYSEYI